MLSTHCQWGRLAETIAGRGCPPGDERVVNLWGQLVTHGDVVDRTRVFLPFLYFT